MSVEDLFRRRDFLDHQNRIFHSVKKNLESSIEYSKAVRNADSQIVNVEVQSESSEEVFNSADGTFQLCYDQDKIELPAGLLELDSLRDIFTPESFKEIFSEQERVRLRKYLPQEEDALFDKLLTENFQFGNPLDQFQRQLKKGVFTPMWQREQQLEQILARQDMLSYYRELLENLKNRKEAPTQYTMKMNEMDHLSESEITSIEDLEVNNFSEASDETETEARMLEDADDGFDKQMNEVFVKYEDRRKTQEELIALSEDRTDYKSKVMRPTTTIKMAKCVDWIEIYRKQEEERYRHPTLPWTYTCQDGRKVTVAPVSRKAPPQGCKPREHDLLKQERPACVTILTLVRDAAARLPNGVGTRADICELLKESQYVNDELDDKLISSIVSGALDRLHYMSDACVKYDNQKKLWLYLHLDRNEQHKWEDNDEYSVKKTTYSRKRKGDDYDGDRFD